MQVEIISTCFPKKKCFLFSKQKNSFWFVSSSEKLSVIVFPSKRKCVFDFHLENKLGLFLQPKIKICFLAESKTEKNFYLRKQSLRFYFALDNKKCLLLGKQQLLQIYFLPVETRPKIFFLN